MFDSGTGSHPELPNGWQRPIRFAASQLPRPTPNRSTAIRAYSEHVGSYRHAGGNQGEIAPWYVRINMSAALFSTPTTPGNQPGWPPVHHTLVRTRVPLHVPIDPVVVVALARSEATVFAKSPALAVLLDCARRSSGHVSVRRSRTWSSVDRSNPGEIRRGPRTNAAFRL